MIAEKVEQEKKLDIEFILNNKRGRSFLWRLLSDCGIYQDINSGDAMENERQLGRRSIGLLTLGRCSEVDEDRIFQMMKEGKMDALAVEEAVLIEDKKDEAPITEPDINKFM